MAKQTFHGSCKCGAVKFETKLDLSQGTTKCNCTSCWKRRWWSVKSAVDDFEPISGDERLTGEGFKFCSGCGIVPYVHVEAAEWNDGAYVSINVAAIDDLDPTVLMDAPIQLCDGRNDDWWHSPAFTKHL